jgi:hypothetical protein
MIDPNKIIARLRTLDDSALQRYAQMHRDDPYTLALAVEESNFRKQMRAAGMGAAPQQPSVADQALATMGPSEEMGIAQIPMESEPIMAAGGGLLAFAQGGEPKSYIDYLKETEAALPPAVDPQAEARKQAGIRAQQGLEAARTAFMAARPKEPALAGLESRLEREESATSSKRDENLRMAMLQAGLGMMASQNPNLFAAIAEGAKRGVDTYSATMEKLEQAAERRRDMMARIEEARRAEARGDVEAALRLDLEAAKTGREAEQAQIAATDVALAEQRRLKTTAATAEFGAQNAREQDARRAEREDARARMQERLADARAARGEAGATARSQQAAIKAQVDVLNSELTNLTRQMDQIPVYSRRTNPAYQQLLTDAQALQTKRNRLLEDLQRLAFPDAPLRDDGAGAAGAAGAARPTPGNRPPIGSFQK